ncbi:hypothetical protein PENTCL1PPCAC_19483 [Pristionchus entomophagus]|uniref:Uncharacterized protein n=1 Tax=Pristionchus entomophagus TaxID=358040 RepID=A0AAV5TTF3_9BILA|nr:hypothetical protein PENTCL1PPCAC_19483 [Pristionchus entomophagus]
MDYDNDKDTPMPKRKRRRTNKTLSTSGNTLWEMAGELRKKTEEEWSSEGEVTSEDEPTRKMKSVTSYETTTKKEDGEEEKGEEERMKVTPSRHSIEDLNENVEITEAINEIMDRVCEGNGDKREDERGEKRRKTSTGIKCSREISMERMKKSLRWKRKSI